MPVNRVEEKMIQLLAVLSEGGSQSITSLNWAQMSRNDELTDSTILQITGTASLYIYIKAQHTARAGLTSTSQLHTFVHYSQHSRHFLRTNYKHCLPHSAESWKCSSKCMHCVRQSPALYQCSDVAIISVQYWFFCAEDEEDVPTEQ